MKPYGNTYPKKAVAIISINIITPIENGKILGDLKLP